MKLTRRQLLLASLGAGQLALLNRLGVPMLPKAARAAPGDRPTKLLTIYVPGGWVPFDLFCPFTDEQIAALIPPKEKVQSEPVFFTADEVENLDRSDTPLVNGGYAKLRTPVLWNEAELAAGNPDPRTNKDTTPNGWAWRYHELWNNVTAVHGIDMLTAAHESARVSALSGVAAASYKSPGIHSWVAYALAEAFGDDRPLGCVSVGNGPIPNPYTLPATAAPSVLPNLSALEYTLSERRDLAWSGLRNRGPVPELGFDGSDLGVQLSLNDMERIAMERARGFAGRTNAATDGFLSKLYDGYKTVSRQLAQDVVSVLEATTGMEHLSTPYWIPSNWTPLGVDIGGGITSDSGSPWATDFELVLKLLKSDLCSAVSMEARGSGAFYFDTHGDGHGEHFVMLRALFDVIGRMLAEMKATPISGGKTLLDDTLVLIFSEFGRTFPMSNTCDHWPANMVLFAGGNTAPNRQIGSYDTSTGPATSIGFMGTPIDVIDEGGDAATRPPRSPDVVFTALHQMGITDVFIPGGPGVIQGVEQV